MKNIKYQNIVLTIPAATAINQLLENNVNLDRAYQRITGIMVTVVDPAILGNNLLIGAKSNRNVYVDQVPYNAWNVVSGVSSDDKYLSVDIPYGSGDTFFIQATNLAIPASNTVIYMTLRLESDLTELPKQ